MSPPSILRSRRSITAWGMGYYGAEPVTMAKFRAPHGPGAQGHGKAGPPLPEAGRICAGGGGLQAPQGRPLPAAHPLVQQKSFALSHDAPHGEPLWSHDLVDLLLEGYEFLLPYYEYMLSLSGDPDPRAQ